VIIIHHRVSVGTSIARLGAALSLLCIGACAWLTGARALDDRQPRPGTSYISLDVEHRRRTVLLHLPPTFDGHSPTPAVIVFHGGGTNANSIMEVSRLNAVSDSAGLVLAYPMGTGWLYPFALSWNTADCCGSALSGGADDVSFVRALITELTRIGVDSQRIYAAGLSDGGRMVYRLGCVMAQQISAIAVVSAEMPDTTCRPATAVAVIAFHGTGDKVIAYDGATRSRHHRQFTMSIPAAIEFWAERDGCALTPRVDSTGTIVHRSYSGCASGSGVELYTIIGGAHGWPGGRKSWLFGPSPSTAISASELMVQFFASHPRQGGLQQARPGAGD